MRRLGVEDPVTFSNTLLEMAHYRGPFPTAASRTPTHVFPREIAGSSAWLAGVERGLARQSHLPVLILWGDADFAFRATERERFEALFLRHHTRVLSGARHYIWDDAPDEVLSAFEAWWAAEL